MGSSKKSKSNPSKKKNVVSKEEELLRSLEKELLEHNDFFDMLVDMIPSKLYVAGKSGDDYNPSKKYYKGTNEMSKEARKAAAKAAKCRKLDPEKSETTTQIKSRMENEALNNGLSTDSPDDDDNDDAAETTIPVPVKTSSTLKLEPGQSRIEALRAKLAAKIKEKQGNRPSMSAETVSKRAARRAERNRHREEAKKRKSSGNTKTGNDTTSKSYTVTTELTTSNNNNNPLQDLQKIDYGKIIGLNVTSKNYNEINKSLQNMNKTKNLHKLLADAEAKKQKLELLKHGTEQDKEKAASIQWNDTYKEADGIRIKDDTKKLKKAIKRKAAKKHKSQKAWQTRIEQQQEYMKNKQSIRQHNLKQRKLGGVIGANLSKKEIIIDNNNNNNNVEDSGKRLLSRPGFEGRRQTFLNGSSNTNNKSSKKTKVGKKNKEQ